MEQKPLEMAIAILQKKKKRLSWERRNCYYIVSNDIKW